MFDTLPTLVDRVAPTGCQWTVRGMAETSEELTVRNGVAEAPQRRLDAGVMVMVRRAGGLGHAATSDLSEAGLAAAFARAGEMAQAMARHAAFDAKLYALPGGRGEYRSAVAQPVSQSTLKDRLALLLAANARTRSDPRVVEATASLWTVDCEQRLISSAGADAQQHFSFVIPNLQATASVGGVTQTRSAAGQYNGFCQQGGLEVLQRAHFDDDALRVAEQAIALALAPQCPSGEMDVLLMPDQMMLQIHESIGHPLELDRILGDERNFAGTSFVTPDMFGHYRYGSELLNVSHDPTRGEQLASFAFDDDGTASERQLLIERGVLMRPLGGALSAARAQAAYPEFAASMQAVATSRSAAWNRAPIDRMSNLNVEAGDASMADLLNGIEHGVLMQTNLSWSIDDSRNKFQFGCEYGRMIRHGQLAEVVRNPNYRGISATFWRALARVGDASTFEVMGTPFCGKGEPSQVIRVGHASPACHFSRVAVFGGAA
jgi:predicted Zn-dependent protease